jgi:hypothetical protein
MKPRLLASLAAGAVLLAACGGGSDAAETTTSTSSTTTSTSTTTTVPKTTTTTEEPTTTTTVPATPRQPLTGEPLASADDITPRAAMVVKIDNVSARQNHTGLAVADIVFEEVVEGRATRFAAVFHSQSADLLGPIRSGRTQDIDLFTSYNSPLFVWSGGNGGVTRRIDDSLLINMGPNHADGYFRGPGSKPHDLYNSTDAIWLQTPPDQPGPPGQQFVYLEEGESFDGDPVVSANLDVGSTRVGWAWNAASGKFDRLMGGSLHKDKTYGQIAPSGADQPLRGQHLAHGGVRRHGALGAAPQAAGAGRLLRAPQPRGAPGVSVRS